MTFSSPWNHGVTHGHILQVVSRTCEWRTAFIVISSSDPNATSLWWRTRTSRSARSSWSWTPLNLIYHIYQNSLTLVILLQVDPASSDKPEIVYEGFCKTRDTSIFAWSSIPDVGHYCWLHGPVRRLPPNNKAICTIRRILYFLQLWTITMA